MKRTLLAIAIGAISAGLVGGALAQDEETELNDDAAVGEEQAEDRQDTQQESERLEEEQAAADDESEQADVSVSEDELPDEGDDAEDYQEVNGDEDVDQAEANGQDASDDQTASNDEEASGGAEMQTDPGEQATSAEPSAEQAEQAPQGEHTPQAGQAAERDTEAGFEEMEPTGAALDPSLESLQVSEVEGMTIVNREGESLGQVENVLRHDDAGDLHAVLSVGGFWIFGGSDVTLPLADMQLEGEQLVMQDIIGEDELDDFATDYDEERYSEVDDDVTLSEAMGR
jgi:hypothetical protein